MQNFLLFKVIHENTVKSFSNSLKHLLQNKIIKVIKEFDISQQKSESYPDYPLSSQSHPRVESDGQHGGLHIICAGSVISALVAGDRIGYLGLHFRRALCSNRRRKSNVYRGARGEGPSSAYQFNACSSANSLAPTEE